MQHLHSGNAQTSGIPDLFAQAGGTIWNLEAAMSVLSPLRTSLLDLAELDARPFFSSQRCQTGLKEGAVGGGCSQADRRGIGSAGFGGAAGP